MNWLDILLLLPLLIGFVRGLMRGIIIELIAILGVICGIIGARWWGHPFSQWMLQELEWPESVCDIVAYALLFLGIAIILNILGRLLSKLLSAIHLGFLNRLCGGIFGAAKWTLVILVAVCLFDHIDQYIGLISNTEVVKTSLLYHPLVSTANNLLNLASNYSIVPNP